MSTIAISQKNGTTVICPICLNTYSSLCERTLKLRMKMHFKVCKQTKPIDYNEITKRTQEVAKQEQQRYIGHKPKTNKLKTTEKDTFTKL